MSSIDSQNPSHYVQPGDSVRPLGVHFSVQAAADPATLPRMLEYFALNNILPETVRSRHFVDGNLVIDIKVKGLDEKRASVIANKLRASVLVFGVTVEWIAASQDRPQLRAVA